MNFETDIEIPPALASQMKENKKMIDDYYAAKKLAERYIPLRRRLDVCREAKPVARDNLEAQRAVQYHQSIKQQIQKKLDDVEQSIESHKRKHEKDMEVIKEKYEKDLANAQKTANYFIAQDELRRSKIQDNMNYVENRLKAAEERLTLGSTQSTKEEINLIKEIDELVKKYAELQPREDLNKVFPDFKTIHSPLATNPPTPLNNPIPLTPSVNMTPLTPSSSATIQTEQPKPKVKRGIKQIDQRAPLIDNQEETMTSLPSIPVTEEVNVEVNVEVQEPLIPKKNTPADIVTQMSSQEINRMNDQELFKLLRPGVKNPYNNVVSNTKVRRS